MLIRRGLVSLRQTFDWSRIQSVDDLDPESFDVKVMHPLGTTRRSIELWNATFKKSFFQIRHELKQLTLKNLKSLHCTDLELIPCRSRVSSWRIMLLSDDDDWVSPWWIDRLPSDVNGLLFCRWQSVRFNGDWYARPNSHRYSYTNNYCIFPEARKHYCLSQLYQHFDQNVIHNELHSGLVGYVNYPLTVTHKHPASANTLRQLLLEADWDAEALRDSVENYLDRCRSIEVPENLQWSISLIENSHKIFSSIM